MTSGAVACEGEECGSDGKGSEADDGALVARQAKAPEKARGSAAVSGIAGLYRRERRSSPSTSLQVLQQLHLVAQPPGSLCWW